MREASDLERRFVIEFEGGALANVPHLADVEAVATLSDGEVLRAAAMPAPEGRWHAIVEARRAAVKPTDLRCYLRLEGAALSETWSYLWS
jgi:glucans biosynthesis protein